MKSGIENALGIAENTMMAEMQRKRESGTDKGAYGTFHGESFPEKLKMQEMKDRNCKNVFYRRTNAYKMNYTCRR